MAVPVGVWNALTAQASGRAGYTHQWNSPLKLSDAQEQGIMRLCMASADTPEEAIIARSRGYRTFRVRMASEPFLANEFACPASPEGGDKATCEQCLACSGNERAKAANPAIVVHGSKTKRYIAMRLVAAYSLLMYSGDNHHGLYEPSQKSPHRGRPCPRRAQGVEIFARGG
jgi:hypothetical protein